jgi:hypothetical protein
VSVDKPLAFPKVEPGPDEWHVHAAGSRYRFLVGIMLYFVCRVDVATMIQEMDPIECHAARYSGDDL